MKLLFENWRKYVNEVTSLETELKDAIFQAIIDSKFWTKQNNPNDIDLKLDNLDNLMGTPASEALQSSLNQLSDIYFSISVGDEKYVLGPNDEYGGYPDNWILQAQYRGPYRELNGQHVVWVELRSISNEFDLNELDSLELSKNISTTINHELIHFYQLKNQAKSKRLSDYEAYREMVCDTKQVPAGDPERYYEICGEYPPEELGDAREIYLTRHGEIDAYAHEAAEQLLHKYGAEKALRAIKKLDPVDLIRYPEISSVVKDYADVLRNNQEELNKFRKRLYLQIQKQS
jgi:hypothetical protein